MRCKPPDTDFYSELFDLNVEFLQLLKAGAPGLDGSLLGLNRTAAAGLARLGSEQLAYIARTPVLLAGFSGWPGDHFIGDTGRAGNDPGWIDEARLYCASLMTYLWQMARRDSLIGGLCFGVSDELNARFATTGFRDICSSAQFAVVRLEARFGRHPRFWTDLIRAAGSGDSTIRRVARLSSLTIELAGQRPGNRPANG